MIRKLIEFNDDRTTKLGIGAQDVEPRQKVSENAWNRFELGAGKVAAVDWTRRLTVQPIVDAR